MIKSMTGFCKTEAEYKELRCNVEVKSVNHRFLESRIHLPRQFQYLEENLKRLLKQKINRGKVDVYIQLDETHILDEKLSLNPNVLKNVNSIIEGIEKDIHRDLQVNLSDLLQVKGLFKYEQEEKTLEDYEALFSLAVEKGAEELIKMRSREGELLFADIMEHVELMQKYVGQVPELREEVVESHRQRLKKNLENLQLKYDDDDPRIMQEVGVFMDRSDITEEVERFGSHLVQMRELMLSDEPTGRKLDFLMQEFHREANTLCSKANHIQVTQIGVDLKCEIEKIREQVQNIE
ncbi:YicC family protein [bacterium]|nr:YicC family protein [bacterium]